MVQKNLHIFSVHAKSHDIMCIIVNLEGITDVTPWGIIIHDTNHHWPTFYIVVWSLMKKRKDRQKNTSPHQQNCIHCNLNLCQDVGNNHLSTHSGYDNYSSIDFPFHWIFNQVVSSNNLLDKVVLTEVITQPIKKPRSVGPHKLIPKKNRNKGKSRLENTKFRGVL